MQRPLSALGLALALGAMGCTPDDGDSASGTGTEGTSEGTPTTAAQGSDQGGPCGAGHYQSPGTLSFCDSTRANDAQADCVDVAELSRHTQINGNVGVSGVKNLSPLQCLATVGGNLMINENDEITDLSGLGNLGSVKLLSITYNPNLKSLGGLDSLREAETLSLIKNGFEDLQGLSGPLTVEHLTIERHADLTSLVGLENVTVTDDIAIVDNPRLPNCAAQAFAARFEGIDVTLEGNDEAAACE